MRFDIITIFPEMFESYLSLSMIKRGIAKKLIDIRVHNLRDFGVGPHRKVDDRPYGGGPGMVLQVGPIIKMIEKIIKPSGQAFSDARRKRTKIILFAAGGKQFNALTAQDLAKNYDRVVMVAGRYEGIDERVSAVVKSWKLKVEHVSIGPYVLTGGELPALIVADAVSRHIPGFLGKAESIEENRFGSGLPSYSRPEVFSNHKKKFRVPPVLLTGNHKKIESWRTSRIRGRRDAENDR